MTRLPDLTWPASDSVYEGSCRVVPNAASRREAHRARPASDSVYEGSCRVVPNAASRREAHRRRGHPGGPRLEESRLGPPYCPTSFSCRRSDDFALESPRSPIARIVLVRPQRLQSLPEERPSETATWIRASFGLGSAATGIFSSRATAARGSNDDQASNSEDQVASSRSSACSIRSRLDSKVRRRLRGRTRRGAGSDRPGKRRRTCRGFAEGGRDATIARRPRAQGRGRSAR